MSTRTQGVLHAVGMRRAPLTSTTLRPVFTVRDALDSGIGRHRLRAGDLDRSVWGVRGPARVEPNMIARCVMFAARLHEGHFYSHVTAARLWGAPLPWALERREEIDVAVASPAPTPHANGILGHRLQVVADDVTTVQGLAATSPARTWCDLAPLLRLEDLVAVGDYLLHHRRPLTTRRELDRTLQRAWGQRGVRRAREAIDLLSENAESRPESQLRVIIISAGLPTPEVNRSEVMTESGRTRRFDLVFRRERVVLEYQGDYHRTKEQWRKDMTRRAELEAEGWYVMEINADDLRNPSALIARIRSVLFRRR